MGSCVAACGGEPCPSPAGFTFSCNAQDHCEYTPTTPVGDGSSPYGVMIWVPAGQFLMGSPEGEGLDAEHPQHTVTFAEGYWVDKFEVTAEAFAAFLNARGSNDCGSEECLDADAGDRNVDWSGSEASVRSVCEATAGGSRDQGCSAHPVQEITWYGARGFCAWRGSGWGLCSEAQWERAAKGTAHRQYPWGDTPVPGDVGWDEALANCREWSCSDGYSVTSPVGTFPAGASPVGAVDMAGNVWEWVEDDWHETYSGAGRPDDGSAWVDDPRGAARVGRGGGWGYAAAALRASLRGVDFPSWSDGGLGARCCRSSY